MCARRRHGSAIRAGVGVLFRRRAQGAKAQPNPAHVALAELEARLGERFFLCTQNVDDLHERAGSVRLVHMHGELAKARCERECGEAAG
jgi:NAD-dependent deacetylase